MGGKTEYKNAWINEKLDRIYLTVPKGRKTVIQNHAESQGKSMNEFINLAIMEKMERDNRGE